MSALPLRCRKRQRGNKNAIRSNSASDLDRDHATFGAAMPVRDAEHFVRAVVAIAAGLQYVIDPGGGIQNPSNRMQTVGDEAVFGLRTTITF